jgi:two-component system chemotaxis response regulator CheB
VRPARIIGVGASAGGIDALFGVLGCIPRDYEHALVVVLHVPANRGSLLAKILGRRCALPVVTAEQGMMLRAGGVYVAPPDHHVLLQGGQLRLSHGVKENGVRPAVDATLRSLAAARGAEAVAVVLSGAMADGSAGARIVAAAGGRVLIQDPRDAAVPSMPERAIAAVPHGAEILSATRIGMALATLTRHSTSGEPIGTPR